MSFTGPGIFRRRRCVILPRLMAGSSCIPMRMRSVITLRGDKLTVCGSVFYFMGAKRLRVSITAHVNNLYNTVFWALVQQGDQTSTEAHATLRVTLIPYSERNLADSMSGHRLCAKA